MGTQTTIPLSITHASVAAPPMRRLEAAAQSVARNANFDSFDMGERYGLQGLGGRPAVR